VTLSHLHVLYYSIHLTSVVVSCSEDWATFRSSHATFRAKQSFQVIKILNFNLIFINLHGVYLMDEKFEGTFRMRPEHGKEGLKFYLSFPKS
jgi:hypothetical protein